MKLRYFTLMLAFVLEAAHTFAQSAIVMPGNVQSVTTGEQGLTFKTDNAYGSITVYSPSVIRVRLNKQPLGRDFSYAVISQPQKTKTVITDGADSITLLTDSIKAVIHKKPFGIAYYNTAGQLINRDEPGLTTSWTGDEVTTYKSLMPDEHFIGLGEKTGPVDKKGMGYTNWNSDVYGYHTDQDPLYSSIPFYIGIHHNISYGIFLDNTYQTDFNFGASNNRFSSFGARGGEMNYYFIYNTKVENIITAYTWLTGRMKMPPLWSLGYQQNRYSYYPETEVLRIAQTLREKKIPCDGITLDIHYMDHYQLFTWDKQRFADPLTMTKKLNDDGFKLTVIVDPGIKVQPGAPAYESGAAEKVFIKYPDQSFFTAQVWPGWCNFTDFTSEKGRAWWRKQVKFFADNGVSGIWNDMNEISTWGQKMPSNILFDYDGQQTTTAQAHNVYALEMARSSFEGAREHFKERPFVLTRSGYAGLQRYTAIWTGDNRAEDDHMLLGVRMMGNLGISGVPFTGMDIGGFTGGATIPLFIRWMQIGSFIPYYRNHSALNTKASEPWTYGEDALEISRSYINLRYKLMPYLYSTFYEATQDGLPIMRFLAINYPADPEVFSEPHQNQYLFGQSFMVAPFESTKEFGRIYFPEGTWYDLYNDTKYDGKKEVVQPLTISRLPVFVKGSSIVPMQSLVQTTAQMPEDTLVLHVWNGTQPNTFTYYEDDGKSYDYEKGNFYKRLISFNPSNGQLVLNAVDGSFKSKFHNIKLVLHGFDNVKNVAVNGAAIKTAAGFYHMIDPLNNIDPQGGSDKKGEGVNICHVSFQLKNEKQVVEIHN